MGLNTYPFPHFNGCTVAGLIWVDLSTRFIMLAPLTIRQSCIYHGKPLSMWMKITRIYLDHHTPKAKQNMVKTWAYFTMYIRYQCNYVYHNDVIMGAIASQITSLTIVYSIVYSDTDQRKHQSSTSLVFPGDRWIPCTNGQLRGICFHLMTSSGGAISSF